jgi:hypothetical protein
VAKNIVIANNEPNIVISPREFLPKREGYDEIIANDGDEALVRICAERPDMA